MKIHCICIAKDEDDFLGEVIESAAAWADTIFIADNLSTDDTPSVIDGLCKKHKNIINLGVIDRTFDDSLIAVVFNQVRQCSSPGDWWCRLDADEIYIDNPREFLTALPRHVDTVWSSHFTFRFTTADLQSYQSNPGEFLGKSVSERFLYYKNEGSERRFLKHTIPFVWHGSQPKFRASASLRRIRLRQYQYRSPQQIIKRLTNRRILVEKTRGNIFSHEMSEKQRLRIGDTIIPSKNADEIAIEVDFMERVVPTAGLDFLGGEGWINRESSLPPVNPIKPRAIPCLF